MDREYDLRLIRLDDLDRDRLLGDTLLALTGDLDGLLDDDDRRRALLGDVDLRLLSLSPLTGDFLLGDSDLLSFLLSPDLRLDFDISSFLLAFTGDLDPDLERDFDLDHDFEAAFDDLWPFDFVGDSDDLCPLSLVSSFAFSLPICGNGMSSLFIDGTIFPLATSVFVRSDGTDLSWFFSLLTSPPFFCMDSSNSMGKGGRDGAASAGNGGTEDGNADELTDWSRSVLSSCFTGCFESTASSDLFSAGVTSVASLSMSAALFGFSDTWFAAPSDLTGCWSVSTPPIGSAEASSSGQEDECWPSSVGFRKSFIVVSGLSHLPLFCLKM